MTLKLDKPFNVKTPKNLKTARIRILTKLCTLLGGLDRVVAQGITNIPSEYKSSPSVYVLTFRFFAQSMFFPV